MTLACLVTGYISSFLDFPYSPTTPVPLTALAIALPLYYLSCISLLLFSSSSFFFLSSSYLRTLSSSASLFNLSSSAFLTIHLSFNTLIFSYSQQNTCTTASRQLVPYRHFTKHTYPNITKKMTAIGIVMAMMIIIRVFELAGVEVD